MFYIRYEVWNRLHTKCGTVYMRSVEPFTYEVWNRLRTKCGTVYLRSVEPFTCEVWNREQGPHNVKT